MATKSVKSQKSGVVKGLVFPLVLVGIGAVIIMLNMILGINENNYNILGFAILIAGITLYIGEGLFKK